MTKTDVFSFINENMSCNLATCIDNKPQTRWMLMYKADFDGIVFHTGTMRDLYRSLLANPQVELCFFNGKPENMIQIRVSGTVEEDKDPVLRKEIIQARPFLNKVIARIRGGVDRSLPPPQHGGECLDHGEKHRAQRNDSTRLSNRFTVRSANMDFEMKAPS